VAARPRQPVRVKKVSPETIKVLATSAGLFVLSQILFLINIQFPRGRDFDEFHYVPSAFQVLHRVETQNWEHPPLAKELMAVGLALWGDHPIGWRFMSCLFGSFTLVAMYWWALALFRDRRIALWAALLTLVNQLLYVQARIGMLDTFMFAFIALGLAAFTASWAPLRPNATTIDPVQAFLTERRLLLVTGISLGLGVCCKWFAVIPWALCIGLVTLVRLLQSWQVSFGKPGEDDWFHTGLWKNIKIYEWLLYLGVVPLIAYYLPFIQFFFITNANHDLFDILFSMQKRMWEGQGRVVSSHPYMSNWLDWPTIHRPIWYAFDKEGSAPSEYVRGVLLIGNPVVLWAGLIALIPCAWGWAVERRRDAFLIVVTYCAFYLSWMAIPRKVSFFYYYYPAGMVLSFALAYVFQHGEKGPLFRVQWSRWLFLGVATAFFIYFFPISAGLRIPAESFRKWMWFSSWI
jgi:dolichyl-phosphate-mannose-protein mannosyltransferase